MIFKNADSRQTYIHEREKCQCTKKWVGITQLQTWPHHFVRVIFSALSSKTLCKGGLISELIFNLVPSWKNRIELLFLNLFTCGRKYEGSDLVQSLRMRPNWKYLLDYSTFNIIGSLWNVSIKTNPRSVYQDSSHRFVWIFDVIDLLISLQSHNRLNARTKNYIPP